MSCPANFSPRGGGTAAPLAVGAAVHAIGCPALFVVASNDTHLAPGEVYFPYRDIGSADKHLEVLNGPQSATQGWDLLAAPDGRWTAVAATVAAFLVRTTAAE